MTNYHVQDLSEISLQIVESLPFLVFILDDERIVYVNKACEELLGYFKSELLGKSFIRDLVPEDEKSKAFLYCQRLLTGIREEGTYFALRTKDGSLRKFLWKCLRVVSPSQEKIRVVVLAIDATESIQLMERIESLHKTTTFSEFLRGLIHDFNNILNNVRFSLKKLKSLVEVGDRENTTLVLKNLDFTIDSWIDVNRLLLDYSRVSRDFLQSTINLIDFLIQNLESFQILLGESIKLKLDFSYLKKAVIAGDSMLWRYIFLNLLMNAKDAIRGEGEILIKLDIIYDMPELGNCLRIIIQDNGLGIPSEVLPFIFKPFYTTKEKGSGLGLYLVKHHINLLGGRIEVESKVNLGTTFYLYVPLVPGVETEKAKKKPFSLSDRVILLLEDEEEIREELKAFLEENGAKVFAYANLKEFTEGQIALEPHLLITDYHLPEAKGEEVYEFVLKSYPKIKVLFITGDPYCLAEIPEDNVLLKPFSLKDLSEKISALL